MAAETSNDFGMSAVCPQCQVVCLKIWDDKTASLATSAIIRAMEFLAAHRKTIKISNHSYGGFGNDAIEEHAINRLLAKGKHLAFVSAGNNGCDIDHTGGKICPE